MKLNRRHNPKVIRAINGIVGLLAMLLFHLLLTKSGAAHKGPILCALSLLLGMMVVLFAVVYRSLDGGADIKDARQDLVRRQGISLLCLLVALVLLWLDSLSFIALWPVVKRFFGLWGGVLCATSAFFWLLPYRRFR